jgi:hypothetical protein
MFQFSYKLNKSKSKDKLWTVFLTQKESENDIEF